MHFDNCYATLNPRLYTHQSVESLPAVRAGHFNQALAMQLGWTTTEQQHWMDIINCTALPEGAAPLAMVYAGHQFGHWAGQLGDGRGLLIGQVRDQQQQLIDLHIKGAGKTPYSRGGDGRAVLRSTIREYLAGHALNALGVRSSSAVGFVYSHALPVWREKVEPAAMLLRSSDCHIRFGHFEWINVYAPELLVEFFEFCCTTYYPDVLEQANPIVAFADAVIARTASMIAQWQLVGFAHGVMNTDNLNITGSTLDFGPFGFMERFVPNWMNNHSDTNRRYCYQNQPAMAHWNLWVLLNNLLPLSSDFKQDKNQLKTDLLNSLEHFETHFLAVYQRGLSAKMGLNWIDHPQNDEQTAINQRHFDLGLDFLNILQQERLDYTNSFRALTEQKFEDLITQVTDPRRLDDFIIQYLQSRAENAEQFMSQHNPIYILRNHMAQHAIARAEQDDLSEVERLFTLLSHPYERQSAREQPLDVLPPPPEVEQVAVSCSS